MKIPVAVIGAGAFGRHHARVYNELPEAELVGVYDLDAARSQALAAEYGCRAFSSLDEVAGAVRAASVAVPTVAHADTGCRLLDSGVDVLVEKPIAPSLAGADRLLASAGHDRILMVGHLERFNPAVTAARLVTTRPMFFEVHRLSIFTPRSLDVDVVLDLMIHDLDVVLSLAGAEVEEIRAAGLPILSPKIDIANVRLAFDNGCIANFTASRVSTERVRKLRYFQPGQYVSVDYSRQDVWVFSVNADQSGSPSISRQHLTGEPPDSFQALMGETPQSSAGGGEGVAQRIVREEPLKAELRHFLHCVETRERPLTGAEAGRRALDLALRIVEAIEKHNQRLHLAAQA